MEKITGPDKFLIQRYNLASFNSSTGLINRFFETNLWQ